MTTPLRSKLPLSLTLPLFVAIAMFVVAVGTTQIGVMVLRSSNETGLRDQALVFLDAVAGHIAAEIKGKDTEEAVAAQLVASLTFRTALLEQGMAARWTDRTGTIRTAVLTETDADLLDQALSEAQTLGPEGVSLTSVPDRPVLLIARSYPLEDRRLYLAATFDTTPLEDAASMAASVALGIDILVAIIAALATYAVTRRALMPLDRFIDRLADQETDAAGAARWRRGGELRQLEAALALREQSEAQRVSMLEQIAQQERDGLLARMAASIAHEVRNPRGAEERHFHPAALWRAGRGAQGDPRLSGERARQHRARRGCHPVNLPAAFGRKAPQRSRHSGSRAADCAGSPARRRHPRVGAR
ncbi:hypothetical protein V6L77_06445 [Pannonibacter sp. Pt2-lr]